MEERVIELFAGSRSIGKVAEELGYKVFSVDIKGFEGIDLVIDIEQLKPEQAPFIPTIFWASIPCTSYSMAGISHHRLDGVPISDFAKKSDRLAIKTLQLIEHYLKLNPNLKWYIENPRAYLRKMPFMLGLPKQTVWYCKYGANNAKPTDVFSNNIYSIFNPNGWQARPNCFNGNTKCHHEAAPRGSRTGTQGIKGNYERSKIPYELCKEILTA